MSEETIHEGAWAEWEEQQLMLRLACPEKVKLLPYAYLVEVTFEEPDHLKLEFSSCVVEITGDGLDEMLPALQEHRITWIQMGSRIKEIKVSGTKRSND